ncbi:MAG: Flp pilus assembly complex ATPase component TadA [Alphaproteobacteria bacterium]|nr:Flp pilus assembly complex ATPase component TadA [Alphaproteobacteria bacterium]
MKYMSTADPEKQRTRNLKHEGYKRLKDILIEQGLITFDQLQAAEEEKRRRPRLLGEILVDLKLVAPQALQETLSLVTGFPAINLKTLSIDKEPAFLLTAQIWRDHRAIAFSKTDSLISISMADPENILLVDSLKSHLFEVVGTPPNIQLYHGDPAQIENAIDALYHGHHSLAEPQDAIVEMVESILAHAIRKGASDLHFQPENQTVTIRYRLDGILRTLQVLHKSYWPQLCVRLKIMANLDIAESRRPQSGRFHRQIIGYEIDFRLSTHPTIFGENIVIRLLNTDKTLLTLDELGFTKEHIDYLKHASTSPQGLIILSGPTGSGKTTTLYALFSQMDYESRNIMTLEEPVEYQLPGIRQTEIREGAMIDFADGVRSILRQDPDVIFIGEIRDEETAKMALRSAMTGHLVIATLHANDSFGVTSRLIDLGLDPSLLAGNIICAVAQRLVRKCCTDCKANGCEICDQLGYKGRTLIAEILPFDDDLDALVSKNASRLDILKMAHTKNYQTLNDSALKKVADGITTKSEVKRILGSLHSSF